jgi:hypothetical protein
MSRVRYLIANACVLFLIAASAYDIVRDEEHWPFSQYPMFNRVTNNRQLTWLRIYAVTQDGNEVPLIGYPEVFPFDQSRLSKALGAIRTREDGQAQLRVALDDCLERYERLRHAGRHDGPAAARFRLYEVRWRLTPAADNVDTPDSRTLVAESTL